MRRRRLNRVRLSRLLLAPALALLALILLQEFLASPVAQPHALRREPLGHAARLGFDRARYPRQVLGARSADPTPLGPSRFPSSTAAVRDSLPVTFGHRVFLPLVQRPMIEARALWVTRWDYSTITDVRRLTGQAAEAGFNTILFQVRGAADAFYTPGLEPWAARLSGGTLGQDPGWDPLQAAIDAAHANGLALQAWLNVYPVWSGQTPPPTNTVPQHLFWTLSYSHTWDDWRLVDSEGVTMTLRDGYLWATPALTDVVDRVVSVASDIVARYDVDGVHLDNVRYHRAEYSYDPFSNAGYEAARADNESLTRAEWQRQQVALLVNRVYAEVLEPHPDLQLSAAVATLHQDHWGWDYPTGYGEYYQDSQAWVQSGTIDAIMPMLYTGMFSSDPGALTPTQFSLVLSDFLANDGGRHVFSGISVENLSFADVAERIAIARDLEAPGHAIFSAGLLDQKAYWDNLADGPYAVQAVPPPMPWRVEAKD